MASVVAIPCIGCDINTDYSLTGVNTGALQCKQSDKRTISRDLQIGKIHQGGNDCGSSLLLAQSFKPLLKMYSIQVGDSVSPGTGATQIADTPLIVAGGLQQYLIKNIKKSKESSKQPRKGAGSDYTTFHDLPDSIHLKIFSNLSVRELCQSSNVCRHWYCVASDNIHWRHRLQRDIRNWDVISHTTNPQMYKECESDWTNKEIYLRCSPEVNRILKQTYLNFQPLTNILRTFWPKKTPRVAMFGPGLESTTSLIARKILEDKTGTFTVTGMFPGQFEGMGSGFTMKMSSITFHLMTLYTSTRQERESRPKNERLQHSRLLNQSNRSGQEAQGEGSDSNGEEEEEYEVRKAVKDLCQTVNAFVFVIDASQDERTVRNGRAELRAMINDKWVSPNIPLVVLSCVPDSSSSRVPCIDIVNNFKLSKLSRPWQVRDCDVDAMSGVTDALEWVVEHAQKAG